MHARDYYTYVELHAIVDDIIKSSEMSEIANARRQRSEWSNVVLFRSYIQRVTEMIRSIRDFLLLAAVASA